MSRNDYNDRLADYVEVKERIALFYAKHPDGRLVTERAEIWTDDDTARVVVKALAYRTADDPQPGVGWSWMVLPGTTPYTRGSELENTETSAWGRAIGALGIGIDKAIASRQEVANKEGAPEPRPIATAPMTETGDGGLIGTVAKGSSAHVDMSLRTETSPGPTYGFKLTAGRKGYQAVAVGPLAEALAVSGLAEGDRVVVWGHVEMIPWVKDGRDMPPYARIAIERVQTAEWDLPAQEAESVPMFAA